MKSVSVRGVWHCVVVCAFFSIAHLSGQTTGSATRRWQPPRTPDGRPDLQGTWTNNTATPLTRPAEFAEKRYFTEDEAREWERTWLDRLKKTLSEADRLGADLSEEWMNRSKVVPDRRTSLIVDPPNGIFPPLVKAAEERRASLKPRKYDDPEERPLTERCLLGTDIGSLTVTPPINPNPLAMNYYWIVQTPEHVVIFSELVHDARIIRIGGKHLPRGIQRWLGDSVGRWEGDTLVVDTTNISDKIRWRGSTGSIHAVERFTRTGPSTITYHVTVDDPETWSTPWAAEFPFTATSEPLFEYACHEGNYAIEGGLRGARADEKAAKK